MNREIRASCRGTDAVELHVELFPNNAIRRELNLIAQRAADGNEIQITRAADANSPCRPVDHNARTWIGDNIPTKRRTNPIAV